MVAFYLAGVILLSNFQNIPGYIFSYKTTPEESAAYEKCKTECGGREACDEILASGSFACYTDENGPIFKYPDCPCINQCMGRKPDDDQLKCFYEVCMEWKLNPQYDTSMWQRFCPAKDEKSITKDECDLVLAGKAKYYVHCIPTIPDAEDSED